MADAAKPTIFDEAEDEEEDEFYSDEEDEDVSPLLDAIYNGDLPGNDPDVTLRPRLACGIHISA